MCEQENHAIALSYVRKKEKKEVLQMKVPSNSNTTVIVVYAERKNVS